MYFNLPQILTVLQVLLYLWTQINAQCVHPANSNEKKTALYRKIFNDFYLGRWSYSIIREYRRNSRHIKRWERARDKGGHFSSNSFYKVQSRIYGEPKCRKNLNLYGASTEMSRSTCPWYVVIDVDLKREPQTIAKAKCSCKRCLTAEGDGDRAGRCSTVNSYIPVIKWECPTNYSRTNNYYHYFIHMEEVPTGCTCNRATKH